MSHQCRLTECLIGSEILSPGKHSASLKRTVTFLRHHVILLLKLHRKSPNIQKRVFDVSVKGFICLDNAAQVNTVNTVY